MMKNKFKTFLLVYVGAYIFCLIFKLFGSSYFTIVYTNPVFIDITNFIDNTILRYFLGMIMYIFGTSIYFQAVYGVTKLPSNFYVIITLFSMCKIAFETNLVVALCLDTIFMVGVPIIRHNHHIGKTLISYAGVWIFQLISFITRNIPIAFLESSAVALIYSIDYYILLIVYKYFCLEIKQKERRQPWEFLGFYY